MTQDKREHKAVKAWRKYFRLLRRQEKALRQYRRHAAKLEAR